MSLTEGLIYAQASVQRFHERLHASSKENALLPMLSIISLAKADLECAESQLEGYRTSTHAPIRDSAAAVASVFAGLSSLQGQTLRDFRTAIDVGPGAFDFKTFVNRQAARIAAVDEEWKGLLPAVISAGQMINNSSSTPQMVTVILTPLQRGKILEKLRASFGDDAKKGTTRDQQVAAAAVALYEALNTQQRKIRP